MMMRARVRVRMMVGGVAGPGPAAPAKPPHQPHATAVAAVCKTARPPPLNLQRVLTTSLSLLLPSAPSHTPHTPPPCAPVLTSSLSFLAASTLGPVPSAAVGATSGAPMAGPGPAAPAPSLRPALPLCCAPSLWLSSSSRGLSRGMTTACGGAMNVSCSVAAVVVVVDVAGWSGEVIGRKERQRGMASPPCSPSCAIVRAGPHSPACGPAVWGCVQWRPSTLRRRPPPSSPASSLARCPAGAPRAAACGWGPPPSGTARHPTALAAHREGVMGEEGGQGF